MAAATLLGTATWNTSNGTKTVVATPAVGDVIVLVVAHSGNTGFGAPTDNNSGGGGTYTQVTTALKATSADKLGVYIRNSPITSATSTTFTTAPGTTTGGGIAVIKVTGASLKTTNLVKAFGVLSNQAASTPAITFSPTGQATGNVCIGVIFNAGNPATLTPTASWTERVDLGYNTPPSGLHVQTRDSGNTSSTITWGSASGTAWCGIILELDISSVKQTSFRFYYDDGSETASTAYAAQDTNINVDVTGDITVDLQFRTRLQEVGGASGYATDDYYLFVDYNAGGEGGGASYTFNSPNLTNDAATTNRLGAGSGSFVAGEVTEDALVDNLQITASNYTEVVMPIRINGASYNNGDTLDFRWKRDSIGAVVALDGYDFVPRITIVKSIASIPPNKAMPYQAILAQ